MFPHEHEDYQWHDATLLAVSVEWAEGRANIDLQTVIGPRQLVATGLRDLHVPCANGRGASVGINYMVGPTLSENGALNLAIHMQSGDIIIIAAENFSGIDLSGLALNGAEFIAARRQIALIATEMLNGLRSFIAGARRIKDTWVTTRLPDDDPDKDVFVLIDSETDTLPMGKVRDLWNPEALATLQPRIDHAEQWARDVGREACQNLIKRFGSPSA